MAFKIMTERALRNRFWFFGGWLPRFSFAIRQSLVLTVALSVGIIETAFIFPAGAASIAWTNTSGGSWSVAANWSSHNVPNTFDDVSITSAGTYTVIMDVSPSISSLTLGGASGTQTLTNFGQNLTVSHASVVNANGVLGMNGGSVNGAGSLTVNGLVQWNGGATGNGFSMTVQSGASLNIGGSTSFAGVVTNLGTVNWLAGNVNINTNGPTVTGEFWNQSGALFDIQCSQNFSSATSPANFHNAGTVRKEIAVGQTSWGVFLDNSGTIQAKSGTILISSGSNLGGVFQADNGAAINFNGGSFVLSSPPNFQGPGTVQFTAGNITLNGFTGTFTLNGIILVGQNTVAATGTINLNGSNLGAGATLTILSNAVLNLQTSTSFSGVVTNLGTVNWLAGNVNINTNGPTVTGEFWNQSGALFDIQCSQNFSSAASAANFHNAGTVRKEIAVGQTSWGVFLDNSGTIQAKSGTILISSGSNLGGVFQADNGAAINFNGGSFVLSSPPNFQGPGTVQFTAGNMTLNGFTGTFTLNGIALVGQNTVAATGTINLNGSNLGAGATLSILSNAVLNIQTSTSFAGEVTNLGTVNWLAGNVNINTNGPTVTGEFWNQSGALFDIQCNQNFSSATSPANFHNAGTVRKSAGTGSAAISVNLNNAGTIQSQIGVIGIQGAYTESSTATLGISLSGISPGTGFGKIQFNAAPAFAGKFVLNTLNGYRPNPGDSFLVISYPSFTGGFTSLNGLDLGGGLQLTPQMSATSLTLVASGHVPVISGLNLSGANVVLNCANGLSGGIYVALMSTNLARPLSQWSPVATNVRSADGNFSIVVTNAVTPIVRQRFFVIQLQ
jgi:hypothetical protein